MRRRKKFLLLNFVKSYVRDLVFITGKYLEKSNGDFVKNGKANFEVFFVILKEVYSF
jgi:hypothetical protein